MKTISNIKESNSIVIDYVVLGIHATLDKKITAIPKLGRHSFQRWMDGTHGFFKNPLVHGSDLNPQPSDRKSR